MLGPQYLPNHYVSNILLRGPAKPQLSSVSKQLWNEKKNVKHSMRWRSLLQHTCIISLS